MLTLEEEIKRLEIQAGMLNPILYSNLIDDYMQLINWLKDYKRLLEEEPKQGHWINSTDEKHICSECGYIFESEDSYFVGNYCANCGAKMR